MTTIVLKIENEILTKLNEVTKLNEEIATLRLKLISELKHTTVDYMAVYIDVKNIIGLRINKLSHGTVFANNSNSFSLDELDLTALLTITNWTKNN